MNGERPNWKIFAFIVLWTIFGRGKSDIIVKPVDTDVKVGESTYLNCSISGSNGDVSWYHYPVGAGTTRYRYVYIRGLLKSPYDQRFRIEKRNSSGSFDLIISQVRLEDAGLYVCQENGKSETASRAELVVLEKDPICATNINGGDMIGNNKCGLEEDAIHLSCFLNYSGNIPPEIHWSRVKDNKFYPIPRALGSCHVADGTVTCIYRLQADQKSDGSFFVCQATRSRMSNHSCSTDIARVFFTTGDENHKEMSVGDEVTCSVSSSDASCTYKWIWLDGSERNVISENQYLKITIVGLHKCEASCFVKQLPCSFDAVIFESKDLSRDPCLLHTIPISFLCVIVTGLSLYLATLVIKIKGKRYRDNGNGNSESENIPLLDCKDEDQKSSTVEAEEPNLRKRKVFLCGHSYPYYYNVGLMGRTVFRRQHY